MNLIDSMAQSPRMYALGWTLLHFAWQGMLLASVGKLILRLLRGHSSSARYVAGTVVLVLMAITPPVTFLWIAAPVNSMQSSAGYESPLTPDGRAIRLADSIDILMDRPTEASAGSDWNTRLSRSLNDSVPIVVLSWIVGSVLFSLRLFGGWLATVRLTRHLTSEAPREMELAVDRLRQRVGAMRVVRVLMSARLDVPCVVGWLRPAIILPETILGLPPQYLSALLAHELAHVRRYDYLVNLIQCTVETLLFYHPAVWWISSRIRIERENCCDDAAVHVCGDPVRYAQALLQLETDRSASIQLAVSAANGSLVSRIRRVLGADASRPSAFWSAVPAACGLLIALSGTVQWVRAESDPSANPTVAQALTISRLEGAVDLGHQNVHLAETLARLSRTTGIQIAYPMACELMPVDHEFGNRPIRDDLSAVLSPHGLAYRIEQTGRIRVLPAGEMNLSNSFFRSCIRLDPNQLRECVMGDGGDSSELLTELLPKQRGLRERDLNYFGEIFACMDRLLPVQLIIAGVDMEAQRTRAGRVRYAISFRGVSRSPADEAGCAVAAIATLQAALENSDLFKTDFDPPVLRHGVNRALGGRVSFSLTFLPSSH